jgi:hypothetical protein
MGRTDGVAGILKSVDMKMRSLMAYFAAITQAPGFALRCMTAALPVFTDDLLVAIAE